LQITTKLCAETMGTFLANETLNVLQRAVPSVWHCEYSSSLPRLSQELAKKASGINRIFGSIRSKARATGLD